MRKITITVDDVSLSARRAWIEMRFRQRETGNVKVALRKESVDRNRRAVKCAICGIKVALRKESVDRNCYLDNIEITQAVALRKESVDRNSMGLDGRFKL